MGGVEGKVAFITGARGMGRSHALRFGRGHYRNTMSAPTR